MSLPINLPQDQPQSGKIETLTGALAWVVNIPVNLLPPETQEDLEKHLNQINQELQGHSILYCEKLLASVLLHVLANTHGLTSNDIQALYLRFQIKHQGHD